MKLSVFLIALISIALRLQAQNVPYEELDKYTRTLSYRQMEANNLSYMDGDTKYDLSFSETNFKLNFYNQSATQAVYKKAAGKEILYLTANIDLFKVTGITSDTLNDELGVIKLHLKSGTTVNTELIEDGKVIRTLVSTAVEIFCPKNSTQSWFFSDLFTLCTSIQYASGIISKKEIAAQKKDWSTLTPANFKERYPTSLYTMQADLLLKKQEDEQTDESKLVAARAAAFIDSLVNTHNIRMGMSQADFTQKNPEAAKALFTKKNSYVSEETHGKSYDLPESNKQSAIVSVFFSNDKLGDFAYEHFYNSTTERRKSFLAYLKLATDNIPAKYIRIHEDYFTLRHPKGGYSLRMEYATDWDKATGTIKTRFSFSKGI